MLKVVSKFVVLAMIATFIGCDSDEEPELVCDTYFLKEERSLPNTVSRYFYNDRRLLEVIETDDSDEVWQTRLTYNDDDQLIHVLYDGGYSTDFFYEDGLLRSSMNTAATGGRGNEMKYYYDEQNRLIKREIYLAVEEDEVYNYFTLEYPEPGKVKAQFYTIKSGGGYDMGSTFTYTMDENPRPYPDEYYIMWVSWSNVLLTHNEISFELSKNGVVESTSTQTYEYNQGGYPAKNSSGSTFTYSCEPTKDE